MKIKALYTPGVITIDMDESVRKAADRMAEEDVGMLAVLDGTRLVGAVGERDVVGCVAGHHNPDTTLVRDVMSIGVKLAEIDEDSSAVAYRMLEEGVRHLPVVDRGKVAGMVSMRDLLALEAWPVTVSGEGPPGEEP